MDEIKIKMEDKKDIKMEMIDSKVDVPLCLLMKVKSEIEDTSPTYSSSSSSSLPSQSLAIIIDDVDNSSSSSSSVFNSNRNDDDDSSEEAQTFGRKRILSSTENGRIKNKVHKMNNKVATEEAKLDNKPLDDVKVEKKRRVIIDLRKNQKHKFSDYIKRLKKYPQVPFDSAKKPIKPLLKPNLRPGPIKKHYKMVGQKHECICIKYI